MLGHQLIYRILCAHAHTTVSCYLFVHKMEKLNSSIIFTEKPPKLKINSKI